MEMGVVPIYKSGQNDHPGSYRRVSLNICFRGTLMEERTCRWEWLSSVLSLNPPCDGAVSYYSQFGRVLDFTETADGQPFKKIHSDCLQKLEWQNPYDELLSTTGEDGKHYHWILPAFFEFIDDLLSQNREFAIIFRTFGTDLCRTLETIQFALSGNHPEYKHLQMKQLPISMVEGRIRCSPDNVVLTVGSDQISLKSESRGLYNYFSSLKGIVGFQDHFDWWARNNYSNRGGKPLWIDPSHTGVHHIFIDDNIRLNDSDSIVNPQVFVKDGIRIAPTAELYNICLVQTNLVKAICDRNYFIKCVQHCEENFIKYTAQCAAQDAVTTSDKSTTS
ncbi:uncharacterized protein si:dkey-32e6.3 isoform X2 [Callorhinchus milii]|uniref:uncharacterized protein si:dkey-32e6.3 isoform X2 n=1 Tax=Callorhinchus milii TaxID=7868 RepID=UPI001C3FB89F|nr:uncharacterized protein si:dkey-32e6.3 isoform X2 [Callorhinchus milii]